MAKGPYILVVCTIGVTAICPGIINTPLFASLGDEVVESLAASVLSPRRLGEPDEYASLARELITNGYMNGEIVRLDGGIRFQPK